MAHGGHSMFTDSEISHMKKTEQSSKKNKGSRTIPALAFVFPYHEMLIRGLLKVGDYQGVKTRRSNWNYRGQVLLYTSHGNYHMVPAREYDLNPDKFPRGVIVGVATVMDSRLLTADEELQMLCNFNNITPAKARDLNVWGGEYIAPLPFGVFLTNIKRFKNPVSFKPRPGAIGIMRVPLTQVAKALKEVGINPKNL